MSATSSISLLAILAFATVFGGVPHTHSHKGSGERASDGAFSPRDHSHDASGGSHDNAFDHEAILGSTKDAEEFDHLSPSEAKARLRTLVKKMDTNKDGFVDRNELHAWILKSFKSLSLEESEERLVVAKSSRERCNFLLCV